MTSLSHCVAAADDLATDRPAPARPLSRPVVGPVYRLPVDLLINLGGPGPTVPGSAGSAGLPVQLMSPPAYNSDVGMERIRRDAIVTRQRRRRPTPNDDVDDDEFSRRAVT